MYTYRYRHYQRDRPKDQRRQVEEAAHDGGNQYQDEEGGWPVVARVLHTLYGWRRDGRGLDLLNENGSWTTYSVAS